LSLQQLRRQGTLIEDRQRVTSMNNAAHVHWQVLDDPRSTRDDVDLLRRLHSPGVAENAADRPDTHRHGTNDQTTTTWRAALLGFGCLWLDEYGRSERDSGRKNEQRHD